jgi:formylglycine-generating enzyme required for sulfatase activity
LEAQSGTLPAGMVYRLPWKSEWSLAHGKSNTSWDRNQLIAMGWFRDSAKGTSIERPAVVGSQGPNSLGIHDLLGNVAEVCLDQDADDVTGDSQFLVTGGSFFVESGTFLANPDEWVAPETKRFYMGFRVLLGTPADISLSTP